MNGAAALAAVLLAAGAARAADVPEPPELVPARLYLEGRRDEALAALAQRHPAALGFELDALRRLDLHDRGAGALTRAALMLHTERAAQQRAGWPAVGAGCGLREEDEQMRAARLAAHRPSGLAGVRAPLVRARGPPQPAGPLPGRGPRLDAARA